MTSFLLQGKTWDLTSITKDAGVMFSVYPLSNPRLIWFNKGWYDSPANLYKNSKGEDYFKRWLLKQYAVLAYDNQSISNMKRKSSHQLLADRYGATGGSSHGGSGRVGISHGFNAKGIGRTPLVSSKTDWYHSHGCVWLEEAIRETIYSEVYHRLFPYGTVPTIAIIDTGERIRWADGFEGDRRAIIVRPNFIRVATLQRSIFFGSSGSEGSDQYKDARRVGAMWAWLRQALPSFTAQDFLQETFRKIGTQYGFGAGINLWPGPPFSSNVTLDGALVDFGNARSLPRWGSFGGHKNALRSGGEFEMMAPTAASLEYTAKKHGVTLSKATLMEAFEAGWSHGFEKSMPLAGLDDERSSTKLKQRYSAMRKTRMRLETSDQLKGAAKMPVASNLQESALPMLYRETVSDTIFGFLRDASRSLHRPDRRGTTDFISTYVDNAITVVQNYKRQNLL